MMVKVNLVASLALTAGVLVLSVHAQDQVLVVNDPNTKNSSANNPSAGDFNLGPNSSIDPGEDIETTENPTCGQDNGKAYVTSDGRSKTSKACVIIRMGRARKLLILGV